MSFQNSFKSKLPLVSVVIFLLGIHGYPRLVGCLGSTFYYYEVIALCGNNANN